MIQSDHHRTHVTFRSGRRERLEDPGRSDGSDSCSERGDGDRTRTLQMGGFSIGVSRDPRTPRTPEIGGPPEPPLQITAKR